MPLWGPRRGGGGGRGRTREAARGRSRALVRSQTPSSYRFAPVSIAEGELRASSGNRPCAPPRPDRPWSGDRGMVGGSWVVGGRAWCAGLGRGPGRGRRGRGRVRVVRVGCSWRRRPMLLGSLPGCLCVVLRSRGSGRVAGLGSPIGLRRGVVWGGAIGGGGVGGASCARPGISPASWLACGVRWLAVWRRARCAAQPEGSGSWAWPDRGSGRRSARPAPRAGSRRCSPGRVRCRRRTARGGPARNGRCGSCRGGVGCSRSARGTQGPSR